MTAPIVFAGVLGFDTVMRLQKWLTIAMVLLTVGYIALITLDEIDWRRPDLPQWHRQAVFGAFVLMVSASASWVNSAADYSRYLPRSRRPAA